MSGQILTVAGGKGGVGKTTTTVNAGIALQAAGCDTLIVDGDLGMTNLGNVLGIEHEPLLHDVLAGDAEVSDAIVEGPEGLTVLAGRQDLEAFAYADPKQMRPLLRALSDSFDAILVDTGAGLSHETVVPASVSDGIILVTTPTEVSITDAQKVGELGDQVDTPVVGAVLTRVEDDVDVSAVTEEIGTEVFAVIPDDPAATADEPLIVNAANSYAAQAYRQLGSKLADAIESGVEPTAST